MRNRLQKSKYIKTYLLPLFLFNCFCAFSQSDYAFTLSQDQANLNSRSIIRWDLSDDSYQVVISGIGLQPTQLLVDSQYIYVVGENFLMYRYDVSTYALVDSLSIAQNTKVALHNNHLFTWTFNNPLTRYNRSTLQNPLPLSGSISGFFRSYAFVGDTAYLLTSGLSTKMKLYSININTMQIIHVDSTIGNGMEAKLFYMDSLLYIACINEANYDYEIKKYSLSQRVVKATTPIITNRSNTGFFGQFTSGDGMIFCIDRLNANKGVRKFVSSSSSVNDSMILRTSSVFDALKYNENSHQVFLAEANGDIKKYDTLGTQIGSLVNFNAHTTTYDIAFYRSKVPVVSWIREEVLESSVDVFPNPSSEGLVTFSFKSVEDHLLTVYNILGEQVLQEKVARSKVQVSLNPGTYLYTILNRGQLVNGKLIVKH